MDIKGVSKPVKYSTWFKKEAAKLLRLRRELEGLKQEHRAVLQDIEDGKEYVEDLESGISELDKIVNATRRELARRYATYDANFRHEVMLDPSLLD